jgi:hypothetical protein
MKPYSRFCRLQVSFLLLVVYALLPIEQAAEDPPGSERSARRPEWNPDEPEGSPLYSIRFGTVDPEISARLEGQGSSQTKTTETKKKKKKEKSKTSQQPASPAVEHLHGLLLNPSEYLDEEDVLEIVREFLTGADMGLAEPVVNAVAVSLADQITKVGKKERSGMLAELRALAHLADPDIKRHRYQALFAPANDAILGEFDFSNHNMSYLYILVIQVPGTSETAPNDEWAETEATVEAEAAPKPKSKGKGKQHKKKGAGTVHKGEVSMPPKGAKGKGHTAVKEKGKEHEEKTPKTTTLIPNGNELLAQLRADTKWLEKGGGTSRTKKQQQISTTAGGKERSSWEGEADVPWLEGDPRLEDLEGSLIRTLYIDFIPGPTRRWAPSQSGLQSCCFGFAFSPRSSPTASTSTSLTRASCSRVGSTPWPV